MNEPPSASAFVGWFAALFVLTQVPLYVIQYIDVTDWPNHLARIHVLAHWAQSPGLQQYYVPCKDVIATNLPLDLIVPPLSQLFGAELAFKIFMSLIALLFTTGGVALNYAFTGRLQYLALGSLLFVYNLMFLFGLFNFLFGLGIAFWLLATWIRTDRWSRATRLAFFSVGVVLLYLCHLSALGVYALGVVACQVTIAAGRRPPPRIVVSEPLVSVLQFIPAVVVHLMTFRATGMDFPVNGELNLVGVVVHKLLLLLLAPGVSISGYKFGLVAGPLIAGFMYVLWRKRLISYAPRAGMLACLLVTAMIGLPTVAFGSSMVDGRLSPALIVIAWAGLRTQGSWVGSHRVLAAMSIAVVLVTALTGYQWYQREETYRGVRLALQRLPEGAKLATVIINTHPERRALPMSEHVAGWTVIDRSTFIPNLFARPFSPVRLCYRDEYVALAQLVGNTHPAKPVPEYSLLRSAYDYVLVLGTDEDDVADYARDGQTIYAIPRLRVVRLQR